MGRTKIPWCDYTINSVKGLCPVNCKTPDGYEYCYARRMYHQFRWNPEIRYDDNWHYELGTIKKPSHIFVGSTMELFGDWVKEEWLKAIILICAIWTQHTFIFLTKQPQNLPKWSPFPDNCWVGVSAANREMMLQGCRELEMIEAKVKFLSIEPMLEEAWVLPSTLVLSGIGWIILGGLSGSRKFYPPEDWIAQIEQSAFKVGIPVFEKDNLYKAKKSLRQEFPKLKERRE